MLAIKTFSNNSHPASCVYRSWRLKTRMSEAWPSLVVCYVYMFTTFTTGNVGKWKIFAFKRIFTFLEIRMLSIILKKLEHLKYKNLHASIDSRLVQRQAIYNLHSIIPWQRSIEFSILLSAALAFMMQLRPDECIIRNFYVFSTHSTNCKWVKSQLTAKCKKFSFPKRVCRKMKNDIEKLLWELTN